MVGFKKADESRAKASSLIQIRLSPEKVRDLDRWAKQNNVTRSEAIRQLLNSGLANFRAARKLKLVPGGASRRNPKQNHKRRSA